MEVSCGEAPYITSRYDTVSGDYIEVPDRIGLLDRKLRVISEVYSKLKEAEQEAEQSNVRYSSKDVLTAMREVIKGGSSVV